MSWMQLAVYGRQHAAGEWLMEAGAACTVLDAWDLDWKERAQQLLRTDPDAINRLYGEWDKTLLHVAAERNDEALTRLALSASPDLRLKDKAYQSTPLEWALFAWSNTGRSKRSDYYQVVAMLVRAGAIFDPKWNKDIANMIQSDPHMLAALRGQMIPRDLPE